MTDITCLEKNIKLHYQCNKRARRQAGCMIEDIFDKVNKTKNDVYTVIKRDDDVYALIDFIDGVFKNTHAMLEFKAIFDVHALHKDTALIRTDQINKTLKYINAHPNKTVLAGFYYYPDNCFKVCLYSKLNIIKKIGINVKVNYADAFIQSYDNYFDNIDYAFISHNLYKIIQQHTNCQADCCNVAI